MLQGAAQNLYRILTLPVEGGGVGEKLHVVDLLNRDLIHAARVHHARDGRGGRLEQNRVGRKDEQGLRAALQVEHRRTIHEHHAGAGLASRAVPQGCRALRELRQLGPGEGGTVGVGRVRGGQKRHRERAEHLLGRGAARSLIARAEAVGRRA